MEQCPELNQHVASLIAAFESDQFLVDPKTDLVYTPDCTRAGLRAHHRSATVGGGSGKPKKAYYVEGTPHQMGYLLGLMAEPEIRKMCVEFNDRILLDFVQVKYQHHPKLKDLLGLGLDVLLNWISGNIYPDLPDEYKQELEGILEGCRKANPDTKVNWSELWVLNVGVDALLAYIYTGDLPIGKEFDKKRHFVPRPRHLAIPIQCNAFSVHGKLVEDEGHLLGRDFMFPTANVFQDIACMIVQKPFDEQGKPKQPFVSMTAPGMIGCIAGMNAQGLGGGVDMSPSGNCNPSRPGLNSLLLVRHSIENAIDCDGAVQVMEDAQRGVSWNYILACYKKGDDPHQHRACVVEAGAKMDEPPDVISDIDQYLQDHVSDRSYRHMPRLLTRHLPDEAFRKAQGAPPFRQGLMVRWSDYEYPRGYLDYNKALFKLFGKDYDPSRCSERGFLVDDWREDEIPKRKRLPMGYYFAPQREQDPRLILMTNMYIIPEMRLFAMHPWTNVVAASHYEDLQWRYDRLNKLLLDAIYPGSEQDPQPLSYKKAKCFLDFLSPCSKRCWRTYYNPTGQPCTDLAIHGSKSLMDLKNRTMESYYGYYGDDWVKISLSEYV